MWEVLDNDKDEVNYHEFLAAMAAWHQLLMIFDSLFGDGSSPENVEIILIPKSSKIIQHQLQPARHKVASRISLHDHLLKVWWAVKNHLSQCEK